MSLKDRLWASLAGVSTYRKIELVLAVALALVALGGVLPLGDDTGRPIGT